MTWTNMQRKTQFLGWGLTGGLLAAWSLLMVHAQQSALAGAGSGFFVTSNGYFVTCCHVIKSETEISIAQGGRTWPALVAAFDVENDLALLKVKDDAIFPCLPIGDPQNLTAGDAVYALGNSTAQGAVTQFIKSEIKALNGPKDDPRLLQVNAPLPLGNSGNPLLDKMGNVVGIIGAAFPLKSIYIDPLFDNFPDGRNFLAGKAATPIDPKGVEDLATKAAGIVMLPRKTVSGANPLSNSPDAGLPLSGGGNAAARKPSEFVYVTYDDKGNLLKNGSFEHGVDNWRYKFDLEGESFYTNNHNCVTVVPEAEGKQNVLKLHGTHLELQVPGAGVRMDSDPVPIKPNGRFKLSALAKSSGPNCRILIWGYKWKPGFKPHPNPSLPELRECYHSRQIYFTTPKTATYGGGADGRPLTAVYGVGDFGGVTNDWKEAYVIFPNPTGWKQTTISDRTGKKVTLGQELWESVEFLSVHLLAINGTPGDLFVKEVRLEKIK
jgi:hypothetical protein